MATRLPFSSEQYFDACKAAGFTGAKMFTYAAGTNTDKTTWSSADESVPHTNPVQADANGIFPEVYGTGSFHLVIKNFTEDTIILDVDNIKGDAFQNIIAYGDLSEALSAPGEIGDFIRTYEFTEDTGYGGGVYKIVSSDPGFLGTINHLKTDGSGNYLELIVDGKPIDFLRAGARGNGVIDDTVAMNGAISFALATTGEIFVSPGFNFVITSELLIAGDTTTSIDGFIMRGEGERSVISTITPDIHLVSTESTVRHGDIVFSNFKMVNSGNVSVATRHCLNLYDTDNLTVEDMWLENTQGDGVFLRDNNRVLIRNIFCNNTRRYGVGLELGDSTTIKHIRGTGTFTNLVDISPTLGDTVINTHIEDIEMINGTIPALDIRGDSTFQITDLILNAIESTTLALVGVRNCNATNLILNSSAVTTTLNIDDCDGLNISNISIPDGNVANSKLSISNTTDVFINNAAVNCTGDNGISSDIFNSNNVTFRDFTFVAPTTTGIRIRNSQIVNLLSVQVSNATNAVLLDPSTTNSSISINDIRVISCTTGLNLFGDNGDLRVTNSDLSDATTPINVDATFTGRTLYDNIIGVAGIFYGSAVPVAGTHTRGDRLYNSAPIAGGDIGFVCVASGSPGTWKGFGAINV